MAATGKTPILLYGSTTPTNTPSAGNLTNSSDGCEIAINVADKNLFFKDSTNAVNTVPIRQSSASSNGWLSSTDWSTFNNKQPAGSYVTSVTGTSPVASSGGTTPAISLASGYGDTQNPYASKTANYFLAAPNGSAGAPTFRAIVAADIPTLNQNTTGSANSLKSNATTGLFQIAGPAASSTRVMTTPDANFTVARTDAGQTFNGDQIINSGSGIPLQVTSPSGYRCIETLSDGTYTARIGAYPPENDIRVGSQSNHNVSLIANGGVVGTLFPSGGVSIGNTTDPGAGSLLVNKNILSGRTSQYYTTCRLTAVTSDGASVPSAAQIVNDYSGDVGAPALYLSKYDNNNTTSQIFVRFLIAQATVASGQINANGASSAAFGTWSDERLKENITDLPPQLDNILSLNPVEFDYKDGSGHQIGFIAQNMQEIYPDVVSPDENGMLMITGWSKTEARLVKAIHEQNELIKQLSDRLTALEGK